jgi:uracil-DNA glycosylase
LNNILVGIQTFLELSPKVIERMTTKERNLKEMLQKRKRPDESEVKEHKEQKTQEPPSAGLAQPDLWLRIPEDWKNLLAAELNEGHALASLSEKVDQAYAGSRCFPAQENLFRALALCPVNKVKVVILGQDPYHTPGQANGLAFSCETTPLQPSLRNIFTEIQRDQGAPVASDSILKGDLTPWASQGVLLLNSVLSVKSGQAQSHRNLGWPTLTSAIIRCLSKNKENLVFLLWGKPAREAAQANIEKPAKHLKLVSSHPSPLSYDTGTNAAPAFKECHHFQKCNEYLASKKLAPIQWG